MSYTASESDHVSDEDIAVGHCLGFEKVILTVVS